MKYRTCFVSNSSSSSFIVQGTDVDNIRERLVKCLSELENSSEEQARRFVDGHVGIFPFDRTRMTESEVQKSVNEINEMTYWDYEPKDFKDGTSVIAVGENALYNNFSRIQNEDGHWHTNLEMKEWPEAAIAREFNAKHNFLG